MIRRPPRSTQSRSSAASDVYKRQARSTAVLVDDERKVQVLSTHVEQKGVELARLRHDQHLAKVARRQRVRSPLRLDLEEILGMKETEDRVEVLAKDGKARVTGFEPQPLDLPGRGRRRNHAQLGARDHYGCGIEVAKCNSTGQQFVLEGLEQALARRLGDHRPDLLSGMRRIQFLDRLDSQ